MQQIILDVFFFYLLAYIPIICVMVPITLFFLPKDVNEKYFGNDSPNAAYTSTLSSPRWMFFKACIIASNMVIIRWQHHKNMQGIHLACPKWYVRFCWVYYFMVVIFPNICFFGTLIFIFSGY